jgi:hypothetical protein
LWYFLDVGDAHLFVIRTWWRHRIIVNIGTGAISEMTSLRSKAINEAEHHYLISALAKGIETQREWEKDGHSSQARPVIEAAYLSGQSKLFDAIGFLRQFEGSTYFSSSTFGSWGRSIEFNGEVDPLSYSTSTLRQVAQLSLRRLGETPRPFPVTEFKKRFADSTKDTEYAPPALEGPRHSRVDEVKSGMTAEQVLTLIGAPDYIESDTWEYDMDAKPAYSLILKWQARSIIRVERKSPALWKDGLKRDAQIAED